jgi:hypothetical protein
VDSAHGTLLPWDEGSRNENVFLHEVSSLSSMLRRTTDVPCAIEILNLVNFRRVVDRRGVRECLARFSFDRLFVAARLFSGVPRGLTHGINSRPAFWIALQEALQRAKQPLMWSAKKEEQHGCHSNCAGTRVRRHLRR